MDKHRSLSNLRTYALSIVLKCFKCVSCDDDSELNLVFNIYKVPEICQLIFERPPYKSPAYTVDTGRINCKYLGQVGLASVYRMFTKHKKWFHGCMSD